MQAVDLTQPANVAIIVGALSVVAGLGATATKRGRKLRGRWTQADVLLYGREADGVLPAIPSLNERVTSLEAELPALRDDVATIKAHTQELVHNGGSSLADKVSRVVEILEEGRSDAQAPRP